jgi:ribosome-binding factor A
MSLRDEKIHTLIKRLSAQFIESISNQTSLITVTDVHLSTDSKKAVVLITVLPNDKEETVIDFLKRNRPEMRDYIREHAKMGLIPFLDIKIDEGEKNRQRIDGLLKS